jgi:hypothetical protein
LAEGLGDFQFHTHRTAERLKAMGISIHERYGNSFRVRIDGKIRTLRVPKEEHGYYFLIPSRPINVDYGIGTDEDIVRSAEQYFGIIERK